jgi:hypothetical protein
LGGGTRTNMAPAPVIVIPGGLRMPKPCPTAGAALLGLVVGSLVSCIGDAGVTQPVDLTNGTDVPVAVFSGPPDVARPDERLNAGERRRSGWFIRPSEKASERIVRAYDAVGGLLFCRRYAVAYEDPPRQVVEVVVKRGELAC